MYTLYTLYSIQCILTKCTVYTFHNTQCILGNSMVSVFTVYSMKSLYTVYSNQCIHCIQYCISVNCIQYSVCTRRYGPTSSSCGELQLSAEAKKELLCCFGPFFGNFWCSVVTLVTFSNNLRNFERNLKKLKYSKKS